MSRRLLSAMVAVLAVAVSALCPAVGQAAKHRPSCKRAHSKTVAKNRYVRVFKLQRDSTSVLYACRRSTGRKSKLARDFNGYTTAETFDDVRLRGYYVAFSSSSSDLSCKAACPPDYDATSNSIEVFNVRRRRGRGLSGAPVQHALVLSSRGAVAWAARQRDTGPVEIRGSLRSGDDHLIDSGNIDPSSLAIEITIISWTRDGQEHFARLR